MNHFHILAIAAGLVLPLQIAFNKLTHFSGNPIVSSLISFSVGTIGLIVYSLSHPGALQKSLQQVGQAPAYAWLGGVVGAFYIVTTVVASPKIGLAMFLGLVIGGQLMMSLAIDHFGLLGMAQKSFTWWKGLGLLCIVAGVVLLKR